MKGLSYRYNLVNNLGKTAVLITAFLMSIIPAKAQVQEQSQLRDEIMVGNYVPSGNGYVFENTRLILTIQPTGGNEQWYAEAEVNYIADQEANYKYNGKIYDRNPCSGGSFFRPSSTAGHVHVSGTITLEGRTNFTFSNENLGQVFKVAIDNREDYKKYWFKNVKISSTENGSNSGELAVCLAKQSNEKANRKDSASGSTAIGSSAGSGDLKEDDNQEKFSASSSKHSSSLASSTTFRRDREREAQADLNHRYQAARQEHETNMTAIKGAQQGFNDAMDRLRQATREKYARKYAQEEREMRRYEQEYQNKQEKKRFLEDVFEEYINRENELEDIRKEYFKWLRGQVIDDPSVDFVNNIIDKQPLNDGEVFYLAFVEVRWKNENSSELWRPDTYISVVDYRQTLRELKNGMYDAVVRTDGKTKKLVVNPVTRNNLANITNSFWNIAKGEQEVFGYDPYGNTIFQIASTSPKSLREFTDRIKPVNIYGLKQDPSPNWDLWEKFDKAAGSFSELFTANPASLSNKSYTLLDKYHTGYDSDVRNVIAKGDTMLMKELLDSEVITLTDKVKVTWKEPDERVWGYGDADKNGNITKDLDLFTTSIILDNPEMINFLAKAIFGDSLMRQTYTKFLYFAITYDKPWAAGALVDLGADPSAAPFNKPYLEKAVEIDSFHEDRSVGIKRMNHYINLYLKAGGDPNQTAYYFKRPLLYYALDIKMAQMLIEAGADINKTDKRGYTVLHKWAKKGDLEMLKFFLELGANPKIKNEEGRIPRKTARHWLGRKGSKEVVTLLKKYE